MTNSFSDLSDHFNQGAALHIFQESIDPLILTGHTGHILMANKSTSDLLGYRLDELQGQPIVALFESNQSIPDIASLASGSTQVFSALMPDKEGQKCFNVQVQTSQYTLDGSAVMLWILHDHTRQVELDQLRQDLAAMLVHDLQGPLGNITSSLELAANELTDNASETLRLMLEIALRSSQHLQHLVASLMDISHLAAGYPIEKLTTIDAGELIDYVFAVEELNLEQRGVIATRTIDPGLPKILADESMLRRILLNLLDNALKHSQDGQLITVRAQQEKDAAFVRFTVADQGQGVPEAYRDLIFEKFQRIAANATPGGLGLGLAFCRLAVEAHGGRIWVEDAPTGGACFCFTMPAVPDEQPSGVAPTG